MPINYIFSCIWYWDYRVVDKDKIELSNLNGNSFVSKDIGKLKLFKQTYIKKVNNKIKIKTFKQKVSLSNIKSIIKDFDIICDGTDNYETRYIINDQCKKSKKILISAAISKFSGHLFKLILKRRMLLLHTEKPEGENNCNAEGSFLQ